MKSPIVVTIGTVSNPYCFTVKFRYSNLRTVGGVGCCFDKRSGLIRRWTNRRSCRISRRGEVHTRIQSASNSHLCRQYIDQTVAPTLLQALSKLSKERPANPLLFLGNFFLEKGRLAEETAAVADPETPTIVNQ